MGSNLAEYEWALEASERGEVEGKVACLAWLYAARKDTLPDPATVRASLAAVAAIANVHPNAAFLLGLLAEFGRLGVRADPRSAAEIYTRGWARFRNIGCAVRLSSLAKTPADKRAADERLVSWFADKPSADAAVAAARATGSVSCLADAAWTAAQALEARADEAACGDVSSTLAAARHAYNVGVAMRDPYCMLEVVRELLGGKNVGGFIMPGRAKTATEGKAIAAALAAHEKAPVEVQAAVLGVLGSAELEVGELTAARAHYADSVARCERVGNVMAMDGQAITYLTMFCFEGIGGPRDEARGRAVLAHGVTRRIGASLCLAATVAKEAGDMSRAAELWLLGAEARMPEAIAAVEGCTLEEAHERLAAENPIFRALVGVGSVSRTLHGTGATGGCGGGAAVLQSQPMLESWTPALACAACGRVGRVAAAAREMGDESALPDDVLRARINKMQTHDDAHPGRAALVAALAGVSGHAALVATLASARAREAARPPLSACAGCSRALYCDRACQRTHWAAHKVACKATAAAAKAGAAAASAPAATAAD